MNKYNRTLVLAATAITTLGTLPVTSLRQMRVDRQLQPAPSMMYGTWHVDMNGTPMTAVPVTGNMTF